MCDGSHLKKEIIGKFYEIYPNDSLNLMDIINFNNLDISFIHKLMLIRHPMEYDRIRSLNVKDGVTVEEYNRLETFQKISTIFGNKLNYSIRD